MKEKPNPEKGQDIVYSSRVQAGRRTYYLDIRQARSREDYYVTVTESSRRPDGRMFKSKIVLYKEDFNRFIEEFLHVVDKVQTELMPDFDYDAYLKEPQQTDTEEDTGLDTELEASDKEVLSAENDDITEEKE
jgi:Protein of unknown function (DUF3276)